MDTVEITIAVPSLEHDRFIGWLEDRAAGFVQTDGALTAYVPADDWSEALRERLEARLADHGYGHALELRLVADRNWNAAWEEAMAPVRVGPFLLCSAATEVPPEHSDATVLRVDPQQSFGTGHHASTRLILHLLVDAVAPGDHVVDVGTGTGVLAAAACHLGARSVLGVDTASAAVTNARDNVARNDAGDCATIREGSLGAVPADAAADVIAANITLDTLLDMLPALRTRLAPGGDLLLSGLLTSQQERMEAGLAEHGFDAVQDVTDDGWWAVRCRPRE